MLEVGVLVTVALLSGWIGYKLGIRREKRKALSRAAVRYMLDGLIQRDVQ